MSDDVQRYPRTATGVRLYRLLPAIYQARDAENGFPLGTLVDTIAVGFDRLQREIGQLYDSWFIETCPDWVVPYIADLVGFQRIAVEGDSINLSTDESERLTRVLFPRAEVANTIRYRRRKGTLAVLEMLARDVAGWPARAIECYDLVALLSSAEPDRAGQLGSVRASDLDALGRLDGPFDGLAHTLDVRDIGARERPGRHNLPGVGLYVWRLRAYSATFAPARPDASGAGRYHFSPLGRATRLFVAPAPESDPTDIAGEVNVPTPLRRQALRELKLTLYGPGRSLCVFREDEQTGAAAPVPAHLIEVADLSDWAGAQALGQRVVIDPELGRLRVAETAAGRIHVSYHYGFSADIGGGEYPREVASASPIRLSTRLGPAPAGAARTVKAGIGEALAEWAKDEAGSPVDFLDSGEYEWALPFTLAGGRRSRQSAAPSLHLRAARGVRPTVRLVGQAIAMGAGSTLMLDGLLITGAPLTVRAAGPGCRIGISHCTIAPDQAGAALTIDDPSGSMRVEIHGSIILGPIAVSAPDTQEDCARGQICIADSIIDARRPPDGGERARPHLRLDAQRSTFLGPLDVEVIDAINTIFDGRITLPESSEPAGSLRYCYIRELAGEQSPSLQGCVSPASHPGAQLRFASRRYGDPRYCRLADSCPAEIARGASDGSEMGAYHDLYLPLRAAMLRARLDEFTVAAMRSAILFVD